jgi:hypothetical protein
MSTSPDPNNTPSKGKWPSGATFMMYCAGLTLVLLAASLVISGKPFSFSVEGDKVTLHGGLIPQGVNEEKAKEKSAELQQQFETRPVSMAGESTPETPAPATASAPFNGMWEGNGSTYVLIQEGSTVILSETTDGITSAYGIGTANGSMAQLNVETLAGTFSIELTVESDTEIKVGGPALPQSYYLRKL